jgi:hypothetical protein
VLARRNIRAAEPGSADCRQRWFAGDGAGDRCGARLGGSGGGGGRARGGASGQQMRPRRVFFSGAGVRVYRFGGKQRFCWWALVEIANGRWVVHGRETNRRTGINDDVAGCGCVLVYSHKDTRQVGALRRARIGCTGL